MPASPFEIVTTNKNKKGGSKGVIIAVLVILFLIISVVAGVILVRQNQNVSEKASSVCTTGYSSKHIRECKKNCMNQHAPGDPWYWINATTSGTCGVGVDGATQYWCDYDECELLSGTNAPIPTPTRSPTPTVAPTQAPLSQTQSYTQAQIATHNTSSNCWLIINNNVYDVSTYLVQHPGGVSVVTPYCGKEATQAFNTQGGRGSHSNTAKNLLTQFQIGTLSVDIVTSGSVACNGACTTSSQCASGRACYISSGTSGFCRESICVNQTNCTCPVATATASPVPGSTQTPTPMPTRSPSPVPGSTQTPTAIPTITPTAIAQVQTSPLPIPETGTSWPTIAGIVIGFFVVVSSIILAF